MMKHPKGVIRMINLNNFILLSKVIMSDFLRKKNPVYAIDDALKEAIEWLCRAQDSTPDGGVSEGYHLVHGWLPSYPETTGYIIETFFDYAKITSADSLKERALRMADWLVSIQHEDGSIPDSYFKKKMVFDTGQVLFGFVRAFEETEDEKYREAGVKAGKWLIDVQEPDGLWQKNAVGEIPHTYYSRVAWSLCRLHQITDDDQFKKSCIKNIEWALLQQKINGWFDNASFTMTNHVKPYTHTIAYTIRGILESGIYLQREDFVESAKKAMNGLLENLPEDGFIAGSYDKDWQGDYRFSCLTGNAQLAIILFKLYQLTNREEYLSTGRKINAYLKSKQEKRINKKNVFGAIAGSFPIWGEYIHFMYPNWAAKFFIDALILENKLK